MNNLPNEKRLQVVSALCEGVAMRAVSRMTGVARNTINSILIDAGTACAEFHDRTVRKLKCRRIEADEIWCFVGAKEKNVPAELKGRGRGDAWTWTAICSDSKICVQWFVGPRDAGAASEFMQGTANRLLNRVQLTTDGLKAYLDAVEDSFGGNIDFAQLVKMYGSEGPTEEKRYSPPGITGIKKTKIQGNPDFRKISTSYVERQNLTMRMHMRRFTRLTNAFSKKLENLNHAVALHFFYYNFVKTHGSLDKGKKTPAMAAGLVPAPATVQDIVDMLP